jgi:putative lipoic acid-binding regulatory protein
MNDLPPNARVNDLPSIELLESTHTFPGPYMFKVIGLAERGFVARTVAAVREELVEPVDPPFRVRETAGGKHVAVTLQPVVRTAGQVLAIYGRLRGLSGLVVLW